MPGGTAWVQISAGHSVDTNGTPSLEKNPQQDVTQELHPPPPPTPRCLRRGDVLFHRSGGGERHFLYLRSETRSSPFVLLLLPKICWRGEERGSALREQAFLHLLFFLLFF